MRTTVVTAPVVAAAVLLVFACRGAADPWPYRRYHAMQAADGTHTANTSRPEHGNDDEGSGPPRLFSDWFHRIVANDRATGADLRGSFLGGTVPPPDASWDDLVASLNLTGKQKATAATAATAAAADRPPHIPHHWHAHEAQQLFRSLGFPLDPACIADKARWWYRTYDGACNWLKAGEAGQGGYARPKSRDYDQHAYADGVAEPRAGPNPRAVSNAFFKRKPTVYYEHTPLLLGLIEFVIHDVTWSQDSATEFVDVPVPADETAFPPNTTLRVYRTEAAPGTGTSPQNPRENLNHATTWIDVSSLYGSTPSVGRALRSFEGGRLRSQEGAGSQNQGGGGQYLPFNTMGVPVRSRPGQDPAMLFAGGDPRTNEDWIMLAVHTLLLREHNRLCGVLAARRPDLAGDDERLYQTVRLILSAKFQLIANSYQMAYFTPTMPWPRDDGYPLFREMMGRDWLQMNPANAYPWPMAMKHGRPNVVSAEMAVVYRFHEFIVEQFPLVDAAGRTVRNQSLFATGFNAPGFVDAGLENVLRGIVSTTIPNFKSGVDESFRTANRYRGAPFDIVTASIVHEREQGLPTFNNYFRAYNAQGPRVRVPIRTRFEDFTSDPAALADLKRLYASPDDVDLVVGCQLDETLFPATSVPTSALIISLFNLISMGNADRFSVGYAAMRCWLVDKPWDCHPSNALEDVLWQPQPRPGFPHFRFYDPFWMAELDFQAHGQNLLWRLVTENTDIACLQRHPLFPADPVTNPVLCALPPASRGETLANYTSAAAAGVEHFNLVAVSVSDDEVVLRLLLFRGIAMLLTRVLRRLSCRFGSFLVVTEAIRKLLVKLVDRIVVDEICLLFRRAPRGSLRVRVRAGFVKKRIGPCGNGATGAQAFAAAAASSLRQHVVGPLLALLAWLARLVKLLRAALALLRHLRTLLRAVRAVLRWLAKLLHGGGGGSSLSQVLLRLLAMTTSTLAAVAGTVYVIKAARRRRRRNDGRTQGDNDRYPRVLRGWPVLGEGLAFQRDAKAVLLKGFAAFGHLSPSRVFGIHLGPQTHYVLSQPADLQMMLDDNPYGVHFDLDRFFASIGAPIFLHKENFDTNLHANLIRTHLGDRATVKAFGATIAAAAERYLHDHPLVPADRASAEHPTLSGSMDRFSASVSARCMLGTDAYAHPELVDLFLAFNTTVDTIMQLSSVLPPVLHVFLRIQVNRSYARFRTIFLPIIRRRRADPYGGQEGLIDFMPFILAAVDDDNRASDLIAISVWIGLRNLQVSVTSTLLDIINEPGLADRVTASLAGATVDNLDTFSFADSQAGGSGDNNHDNAGGGTAGTPWALLRSAVLESIRLCGTATGPARIVANQARPLALRSDPAVRLPPGKVATLSTYYTHRQPSSFGADAAVYRADRFVASSPALGSVRNIAFGLQGPRMCPGQWYVQAAICVMVQRLLAEYAFAPAATGRSDADKYAYHAGVVTRQEVPVMVTRRQTEKQQPDKAR
ncbi:heme peroxidase [Niveomyces insectorum RCEF 264]|uniref:Heme peroxidase n=1 Tax=Niveomyces insectorum RCEF 264 TaxID=1081102 RepID=A0A162MTQ7_9HYPO|nr:heme peroxidase [Niveomyces insectorum RCEF 264]